MHPGTSEVTADQTTEHHLLLMEQFRSTEIMRWRGQIHLIEYPIHNNNEILKKKCLNLLTIMEQTAI